MSQQKEMDIDGIFSRLYQLAEVKSDSALSKVLGVTPQAVANSRKRGSIPYDKICAYADAQGFSLDYIFFGSGNSVGTGKALGSDIQNRLGGYVAASEMADLLHFVYKELDEELFLQEQMPGEEPFWFLANVYQKVLANLSDDAAGNSEEAYELAKVFSQEEVEHYRRMLAIAQKSADAKAQASTSTSSQTFHGSVGQVGGGDIHNYSSKDK